MIFNSVWTKITEKFIKRPQEPSFDLLILDARSQSWWKPEWTEEFSKNLAYCLLEACPDERILSEIIFSFLPVSRAGVYVDIANFGVDKVGREREYEEVFLNLLKDLGLMYRILKYPITGKKPHHEKVLLTVQCREPLQLEKVLVHLLNTWFWFDFFLRSDCDEATARRLDELTDMGGRSFGAWESVKGVDAWHARVGLALGLNTVAAWCFPSHRDYIHLISFRYSYEEIRDKLASLAAQHNLRFKEGGIV